MTEAMIDRLRELLRAATPGKWVPVLDAWDVTGEGVVRVEQADGDLIVIEAECGNGLIHHPLNRADAAYIAACSPDTIAELLDAHDRMAGALAKASDIAEWIGTDIEDYQHGGRKPSYAAWRKAASELCDAVAAALAVPKEENPE